MLMWEEAAIKDDIIEYDIAFNIIYIMRTHVVSTKRYCRVVYAKPSFCSAQDRDLMLVTMTDKELYRLGIIQRVFDRALLQRDAADILELSVRQVQRLVRLYRTDGATAFASSRRGRPANNRIDEETRCKALDLIRCHYSDFGPTLATEKLAERHHIFISLLKPSVTG